MCNQSKGEESGASADKDTTSEVVELYEGKKKKKHKKHYEDDVSESVTLAKEDVEFDLENVGTKKKKKERSTATEKSLTNGEPESSVSNHLDIQLLSDSQLPMYDEGEPKKKKKSKKKKSQGSALWCTLVCVFVLLVFLHLAVFLIRLSVDCVL